MMQLCRFSGLLAVLACTVAACDNEAPGSNGEGDGDLGAEVGDVGDAGDGSDALDGSVDDAGNPDGSDVTSNDAALEAGTDAAGDDASADLPGDDAVPDADGGADPRFRSCLGEAELDHVVSGEFAHTLSEIVALDQAGHSVEDLIATLPLQGLEVEGKFAYGAISKDLEDEPVTAFIDTCDGWQSLGQGVTDSDGRVRFAVPAEAVGGPGRYQVRMFVEGDGTEAMGYVLAVPAETQFVVFDIDGTLTTGDSELFADVIADLFGGDYVPTAYADALTVVQAYVDAGWEVVYLTGRPYWLDAISRTWLAEQGFPLGTVHFTRDLGESLPTEGGVGDYKLAYLEGILADHEIFRAYGNATTDIYAYLGAGIPASEVYVIGENAGLEGTVAIDSYTDHLVGLTVPPAEQPW